MHRSSLAAGALIGVTLAGATAFTVGTVSAADDPAAPAACVPQQIDVDVAGDGFARIQACVFDVTEPGDPGFPDLPGWDDDPGTVEPTEPPEMSYPPEPVDPPDPDPTDPPASTPAPWPTTSPSPLDPPASSAMPEPGA